MYFGLDLTSWKIRPMYTPTIPRVISIIPPTNKVITIKLAQPMTVYPQTIEENIIQNELATAVSEIRNPITIEYFSGLSEKEKMISEANFNLDLNE